MGSGPLLARFVASYYDHKKVPSDSRPVIAFAGRSNVGKSTLINSITQGKKIAKVSQTPGKTQALNFFMVEDRFYIVDLPGYGYAKVPLGVKKTWASLVEGYLTADRNLRGLVFLIDCRRDLQKDDLLLLEWVVNRDLPFLIVMTKADKLKRNQLNQSISKMQKLIYGEDKSGTLIPFSAKNNLGKKEVLLWVRETAT